jgi:hypothetical protein
LPRSWAPTTPSRRSRPLATRSNETHMALAQQLANQHIILFQLIILQLVNHQIVRIIVVMSLCCPVDIRGFSFVIKRKFEETGATRLATHDNF